VCGSSSLPRANLVSHGTITESSPFRTSFSGGKGVYVEVESTSSATAPIIVSISGDHSPNAKPHSLCTLAGFNIFGDPPLKASTDILGRGPNTYVVNVSLGLVAGASATVRVYAEPPAPAIGRSASFANRVHIWMKAFIPKDHPGNPGYVKSVLGQSGKYVIEDPLDDTCYATDNRLFSNDPTESARMTTEFILILGNDSVEVQQAASRPVPRIGWTHHMDCKHGLDLHAPKRASADDMHLGMPALSNGIAEIVVSAQASNPFIKSAPAIQYGGHWTFNTSTKELDFRGSTGVFPAFEAYAQLNEGPVMTVFQLEPGKATTVMSLIDMLTSTAC
jgi:hypothetical protein